MNTLDRDILAAKAEALRNEAEICLEVFNDVYTILFLDPDDGKTVKDALDKVPLEELVQFLGTLGGVKQLENIVKGYLSTQDQDYINFVANDLVNDARERLARAAE